MKHAFPQWTGALAMGALMMGLAGTAAAVDPGVGVGKPGPGVTRGVGAPGAGVADPGINQPGRVGNVGTPGVGAPGVGVVDPGLNQPGIVGNVGGVARQSVRR
jgi:hypothetical protein